MNELRDQTYELIENADGHAEGKTRLAFSNSETVNATYTGPNVVFGNAIVHEAEMVYQALTVEGELNAGRATISIEDGILVLHWTWLTGDRSSGVSRWRKIGNDK